MQRRIAQAALFALILTAHGAAAQAASRDAAPSGSFVGSDSLDARKEFGTPNRARHQFRGVATWSIERDTLDLRPKFTIRLELPAPSPVTIVIRALDSVPPAPGRYSFFVASTGASHSQRGDVNASLYARESGRSRSYLPMGDALVITSVRIASGVPVVSGQLDLRGGRYEEMTRGPIHDYVWLAVTGDFTAVPARQPRPVVEVSEKMQRDVLERALLGFGITSIGAINGDGAVDSTHSSSMGRAFLESRWRDALIVEHIVANDQSFRVRLRGRFVPVVCEQAQTDDDAECTTLPSPVTAHGAGELSGRMRRLPGTAPVGHEDATVYLVPNPVPIRDAFAAICASRDRKDSADAAAIEARMGELSEHELDSTMQSLVYAKLAVDDRENDRLISSVAVRRASVQPGARFTFSAVPAGNYLLMATLPAAPLARHWYVPVVVRPGDRTARDLDAGNVHPGGWGCEARSPFPMIHEDRR